MQNLNKSTILKALNFVEDNIIITDIDGIILWCNESTFKKTGYSEKELINQKSNAFRHPKTPKTTFKNMWNTIKNEKKEWHGKLQNLTKQKETYIAEISITPVFDENNQIQYFICIQRDVTELERIKEEIKRKIKKAQLLVKKQLKNHENL